MLFTASFAGLVPNVGLGPYCVSKYGVVALAEVLRRGAAGTRYWRVCPVSDARGHQYWALGAQSPRRVGWPGGVPASARPGGGTTKISAGRVLNVDDIAAQVVDAVVANRLLHPAP